MEDLGTLGGNVSQSRDINDAGQVTGAAQINSSSTHAFLWRNDGTSMVDLGTLGGSISAGLRINASGQVAGYSTLILQSTQEHAFFWRNDGSPMQDLGTLGGRVSYAVAINDSGQVTGNSSKRRSRPTLAFVWKNDGTPMQNLGTFGGTASSATDINAAGQVTGSANLKGDTSAHAFLWRNDGTKIQDLNSLIDSTDPLRPYVALTLGMAINDAGQILAVGIDKRTGNQHAYFVQGTILTLLPRALKFGSVAVNTASAAQSVTVTNTGAKATPITSIALAGANAGQFSFTDNCGTSLAGKSTCTIKVEFNPITKGAKSAVLNVNGGGGGLRAVSLTGTGV